ncbi:MAG TPA: NIL domain-containing protein [Cyanobacteria bacterium UBA11049]|nr:NIL domain-containing protein [Cyanobacteria bacterium UBA11049]
MSLSTNLPAVYIRTRIPKTYQRQPIISRLISRYDLTINIAAALLGNYDRNYGWFDLELQGSPENVESGLVYLQALNIEIFRLTLKNLLEPRMKKSQPAILDRVNVSIEQMDTVTEDEPENDSTQEAGQTTLTKVQVCIPDRYRAQPVISRLVSRYKLTTNITSALLSADAEDDGWFDLELWGRRKQILLGLRYLEQLGLQTWL